MPLPLAPSPESVGLDSKKLAKIEGVTRKFMDDGIVPGAVMLVARKGQIAWQASLGYRDKAAGDPMRADAIFRLFSMTKPITTVVTLQLMEEGKLSLDDPVSKYLPEIASMKVGVEGVDANGKRTLSLVAPDRPMTILDLLRHTSGLIYAGRGDTLVNEQWRGKGVLELDASNREQVTRISRLPLRFSPGAGWEYGVSTDVLGRVIEVVENDSLGHVLRRRVLDPLDMNDTSFVVPAQKLKRVAQPWQRPGGPPMTERFDVSRPHAFESAGAGLTGTLRDYFRFTTMLLRGGELDGKRILKRETVELMTRDHLGGIKGRSTEHGFGLGVEVRRIHTAAGTGLPGEYGWSGQAGTTFFIDPQRELIAILLVQVSDEDRMKLRSEFQKLVNEAVID